MQHLDTLAAWREWANNVRARGGTVGFVPTMGALHQGHAALMTTAHAAGHDVLVSIFVNPRQFGDAADLEAYPLTPEADDDVMRAAGVAAVVRPSRAAMWPDYPAPTPTTVHVAGVTARWEGSGRPGHFDGVASVVTKLFAVTGECHAYFGEKDFQQLAMIRQMVRDLALPVTVVGVPLVRDADGLALSSRNVRLRPEGRQRALALSRLVRRVSESTLRLGEIDGLVAEELAGLDVPYAAVVDSVTLEPVPEDFTGTARLLVCAVIEGVRLLDNGPVEIGAT